MQSRTQWLISGATSQENVLISAARNRRGMDLQDTVVAAKAVYNSWFTPEFVLGNLHTFVSPCVIQWS